MPLTPQQRTEKLLKYNLDPTKYELGDDGVSVYKRDESPVVQDAPVSVAPAPKPREMTTGQVAQTVLPRAIAPTLGGFAGGALGGAAVSGPLAPVGAIVGGLIGGFGTGYLQEKINPMTPEEAQMMQRARTERPLTSLAMETAPALIAMKPSLNTLKNAGTGLRELTTKGLGTAARPTLQPAQQAALANVGIGGALGAGTEAAAQLVGGEDLNLQRIAGATLANALITDPNKLGQRLFRFSPSGELAVPPVSIENSQGVDLRKNWVPAPPRQPALIPERQQVYKDLADLDAIYEQNMANVAKQTAIAKNVEAKKMREYVSAQTELATAQRDAEIADIKAQAEMIKNMSKPFVGSEVTLPEASTVSKPLEFTRPSQQVAKAKPFVGDLIEPTTGIAAKVATAPVEVVDTPRPVGIGSEVVIEQPAPQLRTPRGGELPKGAGTQKLKTAAEMTAKKGKALYAEEGSLEATQQMLAKQGVELNPLLNKDTRKVAARLAERLGYKYNETDAKIINPKTGDEVPGRALVEQAVAEFNPTVSRGPKSKPAGLDTPPHEIFHLFLEELRTNGTKFEKDLVARGEQLFGGNEPLVRDGGVRAVYSLYDKSHPVSKYLRQLWSHMKLRFGKGGSEDAKNWLVARMMDTPPRVASDTSVVMPKTGTLTQEEGSPIPQDVVDAYNKWKEVNTGPISAGYYDKTHGQNVSIGKRRAKMFELIRKHGLDESKTLYRLTNPELETTPKATYLGEQQRPDGTSFSLYNTPDGSTVTAETLQKLGFEVPPKPTETKMAESGSDIAPQQRNVELSSEEGRKRMAEMKKQLGVETKPTSAQDKKALATLPQQKLAEEGSPLTRDKRVFMTEVEKDLKSKSGVLGKLQPNKLGQIDSREVLTQLQKYNPGEVQLLKDAGIEEFLASKPKVTREELAQWVKENGPRVETLEYGQAGKVSKAREALNKITHEWYDSLRGDARQIARDLESESIPTDNPAEFVRDFVEDSINYRGSKPDLNLSDFNGYLGNLLKYKQAYDTVKSEPKDTSPRATQYYNTISPKDPKKFPVQRVDVVLPTKDFKKSKVTREQIETAYRNEQISEEEYHDLLQTGTVNKSSNLWEPDNLHENVPNTLGWAAIQYETLPSGEKVAHLFEVQSRWGQKVREQQKTDAVNHAKYIKEAQDVLDKADYIYVSKYDNNAIAWLLDSNKKNMREQAAFNSTNDKFIDIAKQLPEGRNKITPELREMLQPFVNTYADNLSKNIKQNRDTDLFAAEHPLLKDYNRLILKAAIDEARKRGAKKIVISDAETAMMSEMLDFDHTIKGPFENRGMAQIEADALNGDKIEWKVFNIPEGFKDRYYISDKLGGYDFNYGGRQSADDVISRKGSLNTIAEELTGDKGTVVDLGEHKNAFTKPNSGELQPFGVLDRNRPEDDRLIAGFPNMEEAQAYINQHSERSRRSMYIERNPAAQDKYVRNNLIFTNPDGTPKTSVTGRMYDIYKPAFRRGFDEPYTMFGKRYAEEGSPLTRSQDDLNKERHAVASVLTSQIDKVRQEGPSGNYAADKATANEALRSQYEGQYAEDIKRVIQDANLSKVEDAMLQSYMHDMRHKGESDIVLPANLQELEAQIRSHLVKIADDSAQKNIKIYNEQGDGRFIKKDPNYVPDMLDPLVADEWSTNPASAKSEDYLEKYARWAMSKDKDLLKIEDLTERYNAAYTLAEQYAAAVRKAEGHNSVDFAALRRAQGIGLPKELAEKSIERLMYRYGKRVARDFAFWETIQSDKVARKIFGFNDEFGKKVPADEIVTMPDGTEVKPLVGGKDIEALKRSIMGKQVHDMKRIRTAARVVGSMIMQIPTGLRDLASIPLNSLPYMGMGEGMRYGLKAFNTVASDFKGAVNRARRMGAVKQQFSDMLLGDPDPVADKMNKMTEMFSKYGGRELLERTSRTMTYALGEEFAKGKLLAAQAGDKEAQRVLKRMSASVLEGVEKYFTPGTQVPEEVVAKIAKEFTDAVQGSYSERGLPTWAIEGSVAPFVSLQRWSIEKSNTIYKDVIKPMYQGNYAPFLRYTLGAMMTGVAIEQLNELLNNSRGYEATTKEVLTASEADKADMAKKFVSLMQMAGYGGIVSDVAKFGLAAGGGNYSKYNSPLSYPLYSYVTDTLAGNISDYVEAINLGEDPMRVTAQFIKELTVQSLQNARVVRNYADADETTRKEMNRDYRVWQELSGDAGAKMTPDYNRFVGVEERKFKTTTSPDEAIEVGEKLMSRYLDEEDPRKTAEKLSALRRMPITWSPSMTENPEEFMDYLNYLSNTQGSDAASRILDKYQEQTIANAAKKTLVPQLKL